MSTGAKREVAVAVFCILAAAALCGVSLAEPWSRITLNPIGSETFWANGDVQLCKSHCNGARVGAIVNLHPALTLQCLIHGLNRFVYRYLNAGIGDVNEPLGCTTTTLAHLADLGAKKADSFNSATKAALALTSITLAFLVLALICIGLLFRSGSKSVQWMRTAGTPITILAAALLTSLVAWSVYIAIAKEFWVRLVVLLLCTSTAWTVLPKLPWSLALPVRLTIEYLQAF